MLCLHCSPPTSDPRAPEQREPSRLPTDINWAPRGLQRLSGSRRPPAGQLPKTTRKPPKAAPPIPEDPRTEPPAQLALSPAAVQVRVQRPSGAPAEEPDEYDPHPCQPSRDRPAEGQPATRQRRPHHLRPSSDLTLSYDIRGRAPSTQSRPPRPDGQTERVYS